MTFNVNPVNDAPTVSPPAGGLSTDEDCSLRITGINFADVDAGSNAVTVSLSVINGSLSATAMAGVGVAGANTNTLTLTGSIADINAFVTASRITYIPQLNFNGTVSLTASIRDDGGALTSGTTDITVNAVNDAPSITYTASLIGTEDQPLTILGISFSDVDAGTAPVTVTMSVPTGTLIAASSGNVTATGSGGNSLVLVGSIAEINAFISGQNISYIPVANATNDVAMTVHIDDGGNTGIEPGASGTANSESVQITQMLRFTAVDDAPTITANAISQVVEDVATPLNQISFADVDSTSGTVTLSVTSGSLHAASGSGVTVGGTSSTLTLTGTLASINSFIASNHLTYTTAANATADVTLNIAVNTDKIASTSMMLQVLAVNDAPTMTSSGGSAAFIEGADVASTPVVVDSGLTVSDNDSPLLYSASVKITGNLRPSEDVLGFTNDPATMGDISGSYNAATGTLTLTSASGASAAQWQAALRSVTYSNSSDTPDTTTRSVSFRVSDGQLDSADATRSVTVTAANDSPQISLPGVISLSEDTTRAITGIVVSDVDAGTGNVQVTFTLPANSGTLIATVSGTIAVGAALDTVILTGRVADINAYIAGMNLFYSPSANFNGNVTLGISISDLGNSGGPAKTDSGSLILQVDAVNDAPGTPVVPSLPVSGSEDVPLVLNGISFSDIDAGSGVVQATFSVAAGSGTFSALAGAGVTLTGSGTNQLVLSGSLSDINAFVASSQVSYLSAANASGTVIVTVSLDDRGNTGTGGAKVSSATFNLAISPVNDAPVNSVPGAQTVLSNETLVFSADNGNAISISDVDVAGGNLRVTLVGINGRITLGSTSGLLFLAGDGTVDAIMTFDGSLADINNALAGLSFTPQPGYHGAASLQIISNDQGQTGSGGTQTDTDIISISVEQPNPRIVGVSGGNSDGTYKVGDLIAVQVQFDWSVFVDTSGGIPGLLLETGLVDREAVYVSGSGSNTLTFHYIVQAGDSSADLDAQSTMALQLNGAVLANANNDLAILTLPTIGGAGSLGGRSDIVIDGVAPMVTSVSVPANGSYVAGQNLDFTVNFSESVIVDTSGGTPRIAVTLDTGGTVYAQYLSGSGGTALVFRLVVASGQLDTNGITLGSSIQTDGATLRDSAGNDINTGLNSVASTTGVLVDAVVPTVSSVSVPAGAPYNAGDTLTFVVNTSEAVVVNGVPRLALDIGGNTVFANLVSGSGTSTLVFQYTVQAGDNDADGISVSASLDLNGGRVRDAAGNNLDLTLNGLGATSGVIVDTLRPTATIVVADTSLAVGETSLVTITFSEAVNDFTNTDLTVANGTLSNISSSDGGVTWTAAFTPTANLESTVNLITLNNAGVADKAGNAGVGTTDSNNYAIDTLRPTATITVADTALAVGETSTVTITFSEAVSDFTNDDLTVSNGTLSAVSSSDGGVTWTATFTPTAGINSASNYVILDNTGVLDGAGNVGSGTTTSNNYGIDGVRPTATVAIDKSSLIIGQTAQVTITFSEAVTSFSNSDLTVSNGTLSAVSSSDGGVTWTATFTPAGNITSASNVITLGNTGYTDTAGNAGTGTSVSSNYAIDTQRPTATIVMSDPNLSAGETSQVTITFSEAVTGFTLGELNAGNGTLSNLSSSDGGVTWTATFTPNANTSSGTNVITLANTGIFDIAGNSGAGTTSSVNYSIDTVRPTATILVANPALKIGDTSQVTITFSQAVSGFTNADLTVVGGTLSAVSSADGGVTWTATFTPAGNISNAANLITLDNSGVNAASSGNTGTGLTTSNNYVIDTQRPTATIVVAKDQLGIGGSSQVTIIFSEAVTGFSLADLTAGNGTLSNLTTSDNITWTATLTPAVGVNAGNNHVSLDNTGVTDIAGNAGSGTTDSNAYAVDSIRPTATIVINDPTLSAGESTTVTITFSEAVTGLDNNDLSVPNGTLGTLSSSDGGITWTATYTPNLNVRDTSNVIVLNNTGYTDLAGNAGVSVTNSASFTIDTVRPTATIVVANPALNVGATSLVTITFSEAVSGFTNADLVVSNGTLSAVSSSDGGVTWTATFTPSVNIADSTNVITLSNSGVESAAGNTGAGTTTSNNYSIDTLRPTATITVANPNLGVGQATMVTIAFSEVVSGFSLADLSVANGVLSNLASSDGGKTWTATLTPTAAITDPANLIVFDTALVSDNAGNAGVGIAISNNYAVDTLRPTATIVVADAALQAGETTTVTITFSEAVNDFTNTDLSVSGGTLSPVTSSDGGITWTATFTPTANLESTVNRIMLNNAGVADKAGNAGVGTIDSNNYAVDTLRPTATIVVADAALQAGESTLVTITFSEAVTGLDVGDFTVANGSLSNLMSSDGGLTWTATLTPTAGITDATNMIGLNNASYTDLAGNTGSGTTDSNNFAIDTLRPTATIVVADAALAVGETTTVTITFSEAVNDVTNADLSVSGGTLSTVTSSDGGITWTATFTPTANLESTVNRITLNNTGVTDKAGNAGVGTSDSNNYAIDTLRPAATIVVADAALQAGESTLVTITFSEAVNGFTNADLTVANGTLSNVSSSDGGVTWTATFTPTANLESTVNLITLHNAGVTDKAGNAGVGSTVSNGYAIDTLRPTATITVADTALAVGETSTITITFSEAVNGFTNADLTVANGTLSNVSSSDGGITWTATFTPTANTSDASNLITLDNSGVTDAAGNAGSGTTDSNNYAIDTLRPTGTIVVADNNLRIGETSLVTITFSEAVTGFTNADLTVANGTLSNVSSSDGGITWTATFTPTANTSDASNLITLDNSGVTDAAGNAGSGTADSNNYVIDTQRPTANIVVNDAALAVGESSTVIITFSEAVTGLDIGDFTVANGSLSNLSSSDGVTWTATLTPTASITDASNVITLNNTGYMDAAGNSGIGTAISNSYAIDTLDPVAPEITLDQATLVNGRQVSPTGLVFISGLETGGSWQYSLDNGVSWLEGRGNSLQLPGLGAFSLWVQQRDVAGNASSVTSLSGVVEPLVPPAVHAPFAFAVSNSSDGLGLAPFQPSEVPEPNAGFLHPASMMLGSVSRDTGMPRQDSWSEYGLPQPIAGVNDWMWASLFAPAEPNRSGFDPAPEQFSVASGGSTLDLKPVLLASESPWDIESLQFSFSGKQELPGWVRLDRHSGQLTINAPKDLSTTLVLQIKVSDGKGHESVRTVKVVIGDARATSSAPAGRAGLSEKMANAANQQVGKRMSMYVHG
ncbi:beta strand repeat-containing protein [Comamonas thiooxydans]|uniref:beta strand repeat-containing protein n=2 Tax=Comamonas thiooxydans TaxID=363952 RepID=UPI000A7D2517|nr:Ig-like domain-containing protein [Comamonas thiooxydans]